MHGFDLSHLRPLLNKTASSVRGAGILSIIAAALVLLALIGLGSRAPGEVLLVVAGTLVVVFLGPAVVAFTVIGKVRRGSRGAIITAIIVASLQSLLVVLSLGMQLFTGRHDPMQMIFPAVIVVVDIAVIMQGSQCLSALRNESGGRGFEVGMPGAYPMPPNQPPQPPHYPR